ncbi:MAG: hypothetical protein JW803_08370 [Endomicrobiales bacterium]|nr:hypothetical protein [Endomicrobiales bacterium]
MKRLFLTGMLLFAVSGQCLAGDDKPGWINGKSKDYPPDGFIMGVGTGADEGQAKAASREKLILAAKKQIAKYSAKNRKYIKKNKLSKDNLFSSQDFVQVFSVEISSEVSVQEKWLHPKKNYWYALSVFDREQYSGKLAKALEENSSEITRLTDEIMSDDSQVRRVRLALGVKESVKRRFALAEKKNFAENAWNAGDAGELMAGADTLYKDAISKILYTVNTGTDETGLKAEVERALESSGFKVIRSTSEAAPDSTIVVVRSGMEISGSNGGYGWSARAEIREYGTSAGSFISAARKGSGETSEGEAIGSAQKAISERITAELKKYLGID